MSVLDRIVDDTRDEVKRRRKEVPLKKLEKQLEGRAEGFRPFSEALTRPGVSLIAEHKRRSPSAGKIRKGSKVADVVQGLRARRRGGAVDPDRAVPLRRLARRPARGARATRRCPSCARTSSSTPYQLYEAAAAGADAILLIVAALERQGPREAAARGRGARPRRARRGPRRARARAGARGRGRRARDQQPRPVGLQRRHRAHLRAAGRRPRGQDRRLGVRLLDARAARRARARRRRRRADRRDADARARTSRRPCASSPAAACCRDQGQGLRHHPARGRRAGDRARRVGARVHPLAAVQAPRRPRRGRGHHARRCGARSRPSGCSSTSRSTRSPTRRRPRPQHVQLHGDEGPSFCTAVAQRTGAKVIKAVRIGHAADLRDLERFHTDFHLLDTAKAGLYGGTGKTWDWGLVAQPARSKIPRDPLGRADQRERRRRDRRRAAVGRRRRLRRRGLAGHQGPREARGVLRRAVAAAHVT